MLWKNIKRSLACDLIKMGETDNMEDTGATLIKNGNEKVVFTKNKDLTNEEEDEVKDVDRMEEDNVSWYERNFEITNLLNIAIK